MKHSEWVVCFEQRRVVLVATDSEERCVLHHSDVIEVFERGRFRPVEVRHG
jgi:hypothetical protein